MSPPGASDTSAAQNRGGKLAVARRILAGLLVAAWIAATWISFETSYLQVCTDQIVRVGNAPLVRSCDPLSLTDAPLLVLVGAAVLLLLPDVSSLEIPGILRLERRIESQVNRQEKIAEEIKNLVQQNQHQRQESNVYVLASEANRLATGAAEATRLVAGFNAKKGAFDDTDAT
jgi:hypothetical protein